MTSSCKSVLLVLFVIYQLVISSTHAQKIPIDQDLYTRFLNMDELNGLSNNKVLDIEQDKYGYIWIATTDGLNRYDGYKFKIYRHNKDDSATISNDFITSLAFDYEGNLWIGTKNGLNKYNPDREHFEKFPIHSLKNAGISHPYVRKIHSNRTSDVLWVETVDGVLNKIYQRNNKIEHYNHTKINSSYYNYHSITEDVNGDIWFGGRGMGPYVLNKENSELRLIKADASKKNKKRDNDIACILQDSKERMWMSATDGFYQYYQAIDEFKKLLPTSTFDIIEKDSSNLWLATGNGLYLYNIDLHKFTVYKNNPSDDFSIIDKHLNCLFIDNKQNLWIGTRNGISIIQQKKNVFKFYRSLPEYESSVPTSPVSCFLEQADGDVWVGTMGSGLLKWNRHSNTFDLFKDSFGNQRVSCLYQDKYETLWIGLWSGKGFYKYDKLTQKFERFAINYNSLKSDWYNDFYEDSKDRLWAGVWGYKGVVVFDRDSSIFKDYSFRLNESPHNWSVDKLLVTDHLVWCTSRFKFLYSLQKGEKTFFCYNSLNLNQVLPEWRKDYIQSSTNLFDQNKVNQIISIGDSILYFATNEGLIQYKDEKFRLFKDVLNTISTLSEVDNRQYFYFSSENHIYQYNTSTDDVNLLVSMAPKMEVNFLCSLNGNLWIGTQYGLMKYDIRTRKTTKINGIDGYISRIVTRGTHEILIASHSGFIILNTQSKAVKIHNLSNSFQEGLLSEFIHALYFDNKRDLCFLGTDKGLIEYSFRRNKFQVIPEFENVSVNDLHSNNSDTLWLATANGLANYNLRKDKPTFFNSFTKHQTTSRLTKFIFEDSRENVWIGSTNNGLSRINTNTYLIDHFLSNKDDKASLWGENTSCIYELNDGRIIVGAYGLNIFDYEKNLFSHFTTENGFPTNEILGILQDNDSFIWVSTAKGLIKLNTDFQIVNRFHTDWGIEPYNFTEAFLKLKTGELLIGAKKGFYNVIPNELASFEDTTKIQITGMKVFDKEIYSDFTSRDSLVFNYDENFFTIEISDFTYQNSNPEFLYKLEGVDKDWVNSGKQNFATYTRIPHGSYKFIVKKKNQLHVKPAVLYLKINPPFWKTIWFIAIEVLLGLSIVLFIYKQQINKYKMREKHLSLEQTLLRSQMNPHFVFNALIAIQSFIFKNSPKDAGRYLSKFAKLMRLFLQNTREEFIPLSQELETLSHYLELQKLRFNDAFDYSINCVEQIDPESIAIPPMMAQPFIENAIEHGFSGIDYPGQIEIKYYIHDNYIRITILDNGIGINKSLVNKKNQDTDHKSLAILITSDRLRSFSSRKAKYDLEVIDRMELLTKNQGTRVTLKVPFIKEF